MPAIIDLRRRIKSVRNTQQITQAMKTVASVKFRKAQKNVLEGRSFWHSFPELIARMSRFVPHDTHPLLMQRQEKSIQVLIIASDKGMAGAFNSNLLERAGQFIEERAENSLIRLVLLGKKAITYFQRLSYPIDWVSDKEVGKFDEADLRRLSQDLMRRYTLHQTDAVFAVYNEFKSILAPRVTISKILPLEKEELMSMCRPLMQEGEYVRRPSGEAELQIPESQEGQPDWDPVSRSIMETVLPLYVRDQVRHIFYESTAAEHAARMMAMDNASKNAEELIEDLTLQMNKIRQGLITKELLEIMTAVEALSKK